MNVVDCMAKLNEAQKKTIISILRKIKNKKRLCAADVGLLGVDYEHAPGTFILGVMDITKPTISAWCDMGCPRNTDGTYNLKMVIEWRVKYEKDKNKPSDTADEKFDLEKEKLKLQIEKMTIEIQEMQSKNISLETHEQILCSRAEGNKAYWVESGVRNLHLFAHKSIEQLRPLWDQFIREAFNQYSRNHK
jgi:hypothetical protein